MSKVISIIQPPISINKLYNKLFYSTVLFYNKIKKFTKYNSKIHIYPYQHFIKIYTFSKTKSHKKYVISDDYITYINNLLLHYTFYDFIIIPIIIYFTTTCHFNVIIINKKKKFIEFYEPYGNVNDNLIKYIKDLMFFTFKFNEYTFHNANINPKTNKTQLGLQAFQELNIINEPHGLCVGWCLLFIHYRILNPDLEVRFIIDFIIKFYGNDLDNYIRKYLAI